MTVRYWQPLGDSLRRTQALLFTPFDLGRWFVLGFTAWLIHLGRTGGSAAGNDPEFQAQVRDGDVPGAVEAALEGFADLVPAGLAVTLVLGLVALAILVGVVLLWVSCRARFVWLENLTARDHRLSAHWSRFGRLGDSFFLWKLVYVIALLVVLTPILVFGGVIGALTGEGVLGPSTVLGWIALGIAVFVVAVVAGYVDFFAESFVTVLMHRRGLGVVAAWGEFRRLFEAHPGHFVLVGLAKLVLQLAAALLVAAFGLATCCVGFLLVSLPYLGAVIQLPIHVALRYYDLDWLGQFADDLRLPDDVSGDGSTPDSGPTP